MKLPAELRIYWWDRFDLKPICDLYSISRHQLFEYYFYNWCDNEELTTMIEQAIQTYVDGLTPAKLDSLLIEALHHYRLVVHQLEDYRKNAQKITVAEK